MDVGGDNKLVGKVSTSVVKACPNVAFMAVSVVEDKVVLSCVVPDAVVATGFSASKWMAATVAVVGGRGGGKDGSAQGQVGDVSKLGEVVAAAEAEAAKALSPAK